MEKQINPKDIEFDGDKLVSSVEEAASKLKSLKDHNDGKVFDAYGGNSFKSGIACPKCGSELYYNNPNMVLTSYPPMRSVECKNCKHTDYVY
jgi:DNA-directed RNA polymerase subunit M/transcription elongation factor TFIIS